MFVGNLSSELYSELYEKPLPDDTHLWHSTHQWEDAPKALQAAIATNPSNKYVNPHHFAGDLSIDEKFWADHQPYLLSRGYQLRPRYQPDWVPSWKDCETPLRDLDKYEDSIVAFSSHKVLDATRVSDGCKVMMKRVDPAGSELYLAQYLSSPHWTGDTRNHTVPILDVICLPDTPTEALLVMPLLLRFNKVPFNRFGEVVDAMQQFLQARTNYFLYCTQVVLGTSFTTLSNIDCFFRVGDACYLNLMMDASKLIPRGFHPMNDHTHDGVTRGQERLARGSVGPVQYYFIDFGLSAYYPDEPLERDVGLCGQDRTVPELLTDKPYDPFKLDVFQLGNAFMEILMVCQTRISFSLYDLGAYFDIYLQNYDGLDLLSPVIQAMTSANPQDRPSPSRALEMLDRFSSETLDQCVSQFPTWEVWRRPNGSFEEDIAFLAAKAQAEKDANLNV
ncbi:hypothetical protein C0993_000201 [Termitomyces sp. T159_Od127]|nr:hypothetical protein C0993_000201 [Termitomyces sp. T159_Od127]